MSEFKIDAVGPYLQHNGGRAEVVHIDESRGVAFGFDSDGEADFWELDGTSYRSYVLVARGQRFSVGDRVQVKNGCRVFKGMYGVVLEVGSGSKRRPYFVRFDDGSGYFAEYHLLPDDRPAPTEGFRIMPPDYVACNGDMVWVSNSDRWANVRHWVGKSAEQLTNGRPSSYRIYIASPIKREDTNQTKVDHGLVPDDRPDPGPGYRLLGDDEILQHGDERIDGCDSEPRRWLGPLNDSECIGNTVREVNARLAALNILAWRRKLPKPFRISDNGPGVYEMRDGREIPILEMVDNERAIHKWIGVLPDGSEDIWTDAGKNNHHIHKDQPLDLVRYIGPLPKPEEPEQWVPTCAFREVDLGVDAMINHNGNPCHGSETKFLNGAWHLIRREQKWTCGDKSEWRPIPVEVPE